MSSYQKIIICGNLGGDPETKHFENGGQVTRIVVATTEKWKDKTTGEAREKTEWHSINFNGRLSEIAEKYLEKGKKVLVEGKLRTRKWQDPQGNDRYTTDIVGREMVMLSPRSQEQGSATQAYENQQQSGNYSDTGNHDDLPF